MSKDLEKNCFSTDYIVVLSIHDEFGTNFWNFTHVSKNKCLCAMQFSHKLETDRIVCTPKPYKEALH